VDFDLAGTSTKVNVHTDKSVDMHTNVQIAQGTIPSSSENSEMIWVEIEFPNYKVLLWSLFSLHTSITSEKVTLQSADIKTGSNKVPLPVF
jgi:hypothetical protein